MTASGLLNVSMARRTGDGDAHAIVDAPKRPIRKASWLLAGFSGKASAQLRHTKGMMDAIAK